MLQDLSADLTTFRRGSNEPFGAFDRVTRQLSAWAKVPAECGSSVFGSAKTSGRFGIRARWPWRCRTVLTLVVKFLPPARCLVLIRYLLGDASSLHNTSGMSNPTGIAAL
jgi:hypothetical protein